MTNILKLPRNRALNLEQPVIMGILNVTPDSFSDGGQLSIPKYSAKACNAIIR